MSQGHKVNLVRPQEWQKIIHHDEHKNYEPKERTRLAVLDLFPNADFKQGKLNEHDGLLDAAAIAEYGRRNYAEETRS